MLIHNAFVWCWQDMDIIYYCLAGIISWVCQQAAWVNKGSKTLFSIIPLFSITQFLLVFIPFWSSKILWQVLDHSMHMREREMGEGGWRFMMHLPAALSLELRGRVYKVLCLKCQISIQTVIHIRKYRSGEIWFFSKWCSSYIFPFLAGRREVGQAEVTLQFRC